MSFERGACACEHLRSPAWHGRRWPATRGPTPLVDGLRCCCCTGTPRRTSPGWTAATCPGEGANDGRRVAGVLRLTCRATLAPAGRGPLASASHGEGLDPPARRALRSGGRPVPGRGARLHRGKKLKTLADRWYGDARPFARRALLRYVNNGCDGPHHRPLVKGLFKLAEMSGDDEAMGHFMVAFDRLVQRSLRREAVAGSGKAFHQDPRCPWCSAPREPRPPLLAAHAAVPGAPRVPLFPRPRPSRFAATARPFAPRSRSTRIGIWSGPSSSSTRGAWSTRCTGARQPGDPAQVLGPRSPRHPRGGRARAGRPRPAPFAPDAWQGALHGILDLLVNARSRPVRTSPSPSSRGTTRTRCGGCRSGACGGCCARRTTRPRPSPPSSSKTAAGRQLTVDEWLELLEIENPRPCRSSARWWSRGLPRSPLARPVRAARLLQGGAGRRPRSRLGEQEAGQRRGRHAAALVFGGAGVPHVRERRRGSRRSWGRRRSPGPSTSAICSTRASPSRGPPRSRSSRRTRASADSTTLWAALAESPCNDARAVAIAALRAPLGSVAYCSARASS